MILALYEKFQLIGSFVYKCSENQYDELIHVLSVRHIYWPFIGPFRDNWEGEGIIQSH